MDARYDVTIVGAGISGLGAALELTQQGYSVLLIESQNRVGGRIKTIELDGSIVEAGANYRELQLGNPLDPFLNSCPQVANQRDLIKFYIGGSELGFFDKVPIIAKLKLYLSYAETFLKKNNITTKEDLEKFNIKSIQDLMNASVPSSGLVSWFLNKTIPEEVLDILSICNNTGYANTLDKIPPFYLKNEDGEKVLCNQLLSTCEFNAGRYESDVQAMEKENDELEDKIVLGGYNNVCQEILKKIETNPGKLKILLNSPVNKIDTSNPYQCEIQYTNDKGYQCKMYSDRVICTLPLGVMKYLAKEKPDFFNPPLSFEKTGALSRVEEGVMNKIILKFDKVFWDNTAQIMYIKSKEHNSMHEWVNLCYYSEKDPILIANYVGDEARFGEQDDSKIVSHAMSDLREIYGENIPKPTSYHVTHWEKDPNTLGSWKTPSLNSMSNDVGVIAEPVGSLYFAGEHLAFYGPNVHGSFISGKQTAEDVINDLSYQNRLKL